MDDKFIEPLELLKRSDLAGGDIEHFYNPNGAERGREIRRGRILRLEDSGKYIKIFCEWTAKWNPKKKVWIKTRQKMPWEITRMQSEYKINKMHEEDDKSIQMECWVPMFVCARLSIYPKGHPSVLDATKIEGT